MASPTAAPPVVPPPPRRRIHAGAIVLVLVGVIFLLHNFGVVSWFHVYARWWPALLILVGAVKLYEYYQARRDAGTAVGVTGGTVILMIFIVMTGLVASQIERVDWGRIRNDMGIEDEDIFGSGYYYNGSIDQEFPANGSLKVSGERGDITITSSNDNMIHVNWKKRISAMNQSLANSANDATKIRVQANGAIMNVDATPSSTGAYRVVRTDMEISLPKKADLTLETRSGDLNVVSHDGEIRIVHDRGQVNVEDINGNVFLTGKDDKIALRAVRVNGNITVEGQTDEVTAEDVSGSITLNGDRFNQIRLTHVAKPVTLKSAGTDMEIASLGGDLDMGPGDLRADSITGPVRIKTHKATQIHLDGVNGDVQIENSNGDISIGATKLGNYDIRNYHADISLSLPPKAAFTLDAATREAEVSTDFQGLRIENGDREGRGTGSVGNNGPRLNLRNEGADISILRAGSDTATVEATTQTVAARPPRDVVDPNAWYRMVNQVTGSCADDRGWGESNGSAVHQWSCKPGLQRNQEWRFEPTEAGYYAVHTRQAKRLVIDASNWGTDNGTRIQLWEYAGGTNQQWMPVSLGNGYFKIVGRASGRCLDVPGASRENGVQLQLYDCNGSGSQAFKLEKR